MEVQPSMVMHWNTVSIAKPMLSKDVMPLLGPCHLSIQTEFPSRHQLLPWLPACVSLSALQGTSSSPSFTISSNIKNNLFYLETSFAPVEITNFTAILIRFYETKDSIIINLKFFVKFKPHRVSISGVDFFGIVLVPQNTYEII